jgi:hypothetical protein
MKKVNELIVTKNNKEKIESHDKPKETKKAKYGNKKNISNRRKRYIFARCQELFKECPHNHE